MAKIGIVIRTFNESKLLEKTINAIFNQTESKFEMVIVDSGSTDNTIDIAKRFHQIKIIEISPKEFTYGRSLNIGIEAVEEDTKYVILLSAHAIPCDNRWLMELISPMQKDPNVVGVYGKQVPFTKHMSNPIVRVLAVDAYPRFYGLSKNTTNNSFFFSNANSAIRRSAWETNRFNEYLPYSEDQYWAKIMISAGMSICYQPTAMVYHSHPDSYLGFYRRKFDQERASYLIDPEIYPILNKFQLLIKIKKIFRKYLKASVECRYPIGIHWDVFRFDLINSIATYRGRRHAQNYG